MHALEEMKKIIEELKMENESLKSEQQINEVMSENEELQRIIED